MLIQPKERKIRVVLPFSYKGKDLKEGDELTVDSGFAHEMKSANKAVLVDADPKPIAYAPTVSPNQLPPDKQPPGTKTPVKQEAAAAPAATAKGK